MKTIACLMIINVMVYNVYAQDTKEKEWTRWSYLKYSSQTEKNVKQSNKEKSDSGNTNSYNYKTGNNSNNQLLQSPVNLPDIVIDDFGGNPDFYHSENSVFISPVNLDVVLNSNNFHKFFLDTICGSFPPIAGITPQGVSAQNSIDGGQIWSGLIGDLNNSIGDPTVAIGRNGRMYIGYVNIDICNVDAIQVSWSDDGITWNEVLVYKDTGKFQDKPHLWIDNRQFKQDGTLNPDSGNLYIAWTDWSPPTERVLISRSTDDGLTWSSAIEISAGVSALEANEGVNVQTGPNGEVYVCWAVYDNFPSSGGDAIAIGFTKSLDGGITWTTAQRIIFNIEGIDSWQGSPPSELGGGKDMRVNSFPVMTANQQNGEIYIVWTNRGEPFNNTGDPDIYIIKSTNQGNTWDSDSLDPVRVNQDPIGNGKDQWFPWIACDETSGALVVIYYDSRNDNTRAETFVSISYDGGATWEDHLISDVNWSGQAFVINYAGDYIGIDVSHGRAVPVWSAEDPVNGNMLAYTQPFDVPCPADLILCNAIITNEAAYNVTNNITVGGTGCEYIIRNTANVKMEAGNEIVISGEFISEGEFIAQIEQICTVFGQKMGNINSPNSENNTNDGNIIIDEPEANESMPAENGTVRIYPNPNNGKFTIIILPTEEETAIYIEDVLGRMIYNSEITYPQSEIDISFHPKGIYFVIVIQGNNITRKKIVQQ